MYFSSGVAVGILCMHLMVVFLLGAHLDNCRERNDGKACRVELTLTGVRVFP